MTLAGRMISSDLGGAMVTNHLGKPSRAHHSLFQALHFVLAPAYALAVNLLHLIHACGCFPA